MISRDCNFIAVGSRIWKSERLILDVISGRLDYFPGLPIMIMHVDSAARRLDHYDNKKAHGLSRLGFE